MWYMLPAIQQAPGSWPHQQMQAPWHDRGLFMGLHWLWWLFWILTVVLVIWGFWRAFSDRRTTRETTRHVEAAEEALRARFARGEIGEEEYARKLHVLRDTAVPH